MDRAVEFSSFRVETAAFMLVCGFLGAPGIACKAREPFNCFERRDDSLLGLGPNLRILCVDSVKFGGKWRESAHLHGTASALAKLLRQTRACGSTFCNKDRAQPRRDTPSA